jgi:hypothetical protein
MYLSAVSFFYALKSILYQGLLKLRAAFTALNEPICGAKGVMNCEIEAYTLYIVVSYR